MPGIRSVPTWYAGTRFASTLEADWAATFDMFGWYWEYEPQALILSTGEWYRPDFYLPAQRVWCEAKGPLDERIHKTRDLHQSLNYDEWDWHSRLVVILRPPGPGEGAMWEAASDGQDIVLVKCADCQHYCFMDYNGIWSCRHHFSVGKTPNVPWCNGGECLRPGDAKFFSPSRKQPRGAA